MPIDPIASRGKTPNDINTFELLSWIRNTTQTTSKKSKGYLALE